jgi:hypothetical protein
MGEPELAEPVAISSRHRPHITPWNRVMIVLPRRAAPLSYETLLCPKSFRRSSFPRRPAAFIENMDCFPVSTLPEGPKWTYELKLDGYRLEVLWEKRGFPCRSIGSRTNGSSRQPGLRTYAAERSNGKSRSILFWVMSANVEAQPKGLLCVNLCRSPARRDQIGCPIPLPMR